ncbi:hypothetical protein BJP43_05115 [Candidatus Williamhamiltonella defendens]|uniref:Antitoxin FitA-like ribbon-helix-helix domain-containing protein n=1 Tax=Candidatus Williamhamiltonella defendens TaxID=138072 RepID=A0A2D3TD63_9ENTR|nr:hypothetical protein BJP43_05115 [Candidatus Hamiltonella defensa]
MPAVTIRNLSEEIYQNIKLRAVKNGRSAEAEIRQILKEAVSPTSYLKIGSELAAFSQKFGPSAKEDLPLALARHATNQIASLEN